MQIKENIEIKHSTKSIDYIDSLNFMENRVSEIIQENKKELIWFLNHDHIYTIGTSGNKNEIHSKIEIPVIKTNRGGKTTYHGPGQRIIYFLINLKKRNKDIRKFVSIIESSVIKVLNEFNLNGKTFPDRIGIWINEKNNIKFKKEKKIGAIGLRIKKWVTYHGLSFNINPNLKHYNKIDPCGLKGYRSTSMHSLGLQISNEDFDKLFLNFFLEELKKL